MRAGYLLHQLAAQAAYRLPRVIVGYALSRAFAHATSDKWPKTDSAALTALEMMSRWDRPQGATLREHLRAKQP